MELSSGEPIWISVSEVPANSPPRSAATIAEIHAGTDFHHVVIDQHARAHLAVIRQIEQSLLVLVLRIDEEPAVDVERLIELRAEQRAAAELCQCVPFGTECVDTFLTPARAYAEFAVTAAVLLPVDPHSQVADAGGMGDGLDGQHIVSIDTLDFIIDPGKFIEPVDLGDIFFELVAIQPFAGLLTDHVAQ